LVRSVIKQNSEPDSIQLKSRTRIILQAMAACGCVIVLTHFLEGRFASWNLTVEYNPSMLEGASWWMGRLDLPTRLWDTALIPEANKVYNVFPPLLSLIGFAASAKWALTGHGPLPAFDILPFLLFGVVPLIVAYYVFRQRCGSALWATLLLTAWYAGTAMWPCIDEARKDGVHHLNHILSQIGLLIFAGELLGRRRTWILLAGLAVAAWSRQLTIFYGIALLAVSLPSDTLRTAAADSRRKIAVVVGLAAIFVVPMALNWAKFGSPFETGYKYLYVGRTTGIADDARAHGIFSTHFIRKNGYYMLAATPWNADATGRWMWSPNPEGASIWLTSPILILALCAARFWWPQKRVRWLMLSSLPIIAAHLCYHNTGYIQWGYQRFALDYAPVWLVVAAPWLASGRRRWITIGCALWSVMYFAMIVRWTPPAG
jgi:hypothetical protein